MSSRINTGHLALAKANAPKPVSRRRCRPQVETLEVRHLLAGELDLTGVEWRTIDGTNNNVANPRREQPRRQQIRFGYGDRFPDDNGDADHHRTAAGQPTHDQQRDPRPERQRAQRPASDRLGLSVGPVDHARHGPDPQRSRSSTCCPTGRRAISASRSSTRTIRSGPIRFPSTARSSPRAPA